MSEAFDSDGDEREGDAITSWDQFTKLATTLITLDGTELVNAWDSLSSSRRTLLCELAKNSLREVGMPPGKLVPVVALTCLPLSAVIRDVETGQFFSQGTLSKRVKALCSTDSAPVRRGTRTQKAKAAKEESPDEEGLSVELDAEERAEIEAELAALGTVELDADEMSGLRMRIAELLDSATQLRRAAKLEPLGPLELITLDADKLTEAGRLLHQDILASKALLSPKAPPEKPVKKAIAPKAFLLTSDPLAGLRKVTLGRPTKGADPSAFFAGLMSKGDSASVGGDGGLLAQSSLPISDSEWSSDDDDDEDPGVRAARYLARALRQRAGPTGTATKASRKMKKLLKLGLSHPLANKPLKAVKFGAGKRDEMLGLEHIDSVTHSGERSVMQWLRDDVLLDISETASNKRNLGELKFLCFLIDLMLREPALVAATKSGSSSVLDVVGRRCLLLQGILTEELQWATGERLLPAATLKSSALDVGIKRRLDKMLKDSGSKVAGAGAGGKAKE